MSVDEKFFAWLDGELSDADSAEWKARVESDPELSALAEQHRAMQARLKGAFDTIAMAPVPDRLISAVSHDSSNVVDLSARPAAKARRFASLPQWAMIAATLVVGIFVGTLTGGRDSSPVAIRGGSIYASSGLAKALDTQLASAPAGPVRIGLTFHDSAGSICRSFSGSAGSGLACRSDGKWRLRGLFPAAEGQATDYRMAAGMSPALASLIDSTIAGEPMDAAQEKAARESGWR